MDAGRVWLAERDVDLDTLLAADDRVGISSGRAGRAKLVYRISSPMRTIKPTGSGIELRCATADGKSVQDVLPPTVHPLTKKPYVWDLGIVGDWRRPPPIPAALLAAWRAEVGTAVTSVAPPAAAPDVDRLRALLAKHDPNCGYDQWLKAGMALHHATQGSTVGLAVWDEWSRKATGKASDGSPKYKGVADLRPHWGSFGKSTGTRVVTTASLEVERPATADEFPDVVQEAGVELMAEKPKRNLRLAPATGLQTDGSRGGKILCNVHNGAILMKQLEGDDVLVNADAFLDTTLLQLPGETRRPITDVDYVRIQVILQRKGLQQISLENVRNAAAFVAQQRTMDSLRDWLLTLKWDGERRLTTWMRYAFGAPTDRYHLRTARNWLISMAARGLRPGCKVNSAVILEGPQGAKKSTAFRALVPDGMYAELTAHPDSKDCEQRLRGLWLAEFPEGWMIERASVARVKQYITNQVDRYRPSYARVEKTHPRRCVFVAGTNEKSYLKDQTGGRRFFPVTVGAIDVEWIKANREQLFAEAVQALDHGRKWWAWPTAVMQAAQETRTFYDAWEEDVSGFAESLALKDPATNRLYVTLRQIMGAMQLQAKDQTPAAQNRIGAILHRLGYENATQRRIGGDRIRPWYLPKPETDIALDPLLM